MTAEAGKSAKAGAPGNTEEAAERLAKFLYDTMENLGPTSETKVEWENLSDHDREFYQLSVQALLEQRRWILLAMKD